MTSLFLQVVVDDAKNGKELARNKLNEPETEEWEVAEDEEMVKVLAAAEAVEEAEAAERMTKKAIDLTKRKCSNISRHKAARPFIVPSSTTALVQQDKQTEALIKTFFAGAPMELLSYQRNIDP